MKSSNFGPAMHEVWRKSLKDTVHVQCGKGPEGKKKAVTLRHRLYQLRKCLEAEGNPIGEAAGRVSLQIRDVSGNWVLIAAVSDMKFEELLAENGIAPPPAPELILPEDEEPKV